MTTIRAVRGAPHIDRDDPTVILSETHVLFVEAAALPRDLAQHTTEPARSSA
jgi:hypothetical protein